VVRIERNRAVVLWHDVDHMARHRLEGLTEPALPDDAETAARKPAMLKVPPPPPATRQHLASSQGQGRVESLQLFTLNRMPRLL
jgi:hypothetical protein